MYDILDCAELHQHSTNWKKDKEQWITLDMNIAINREITKLL